MLWQRIANAARRPLPFLALSLLAGGCGGGGDKPASVSGKVTYKGKTVTSGVVVLVGADGKKSDPGPVQPDGTYSIAHSPAGPVQVAFDNPAPPKVDRRTAAKNPEAQEQAQDAARYVATPLQYGDPAKSGVSLTLKAGRNTDCDINLP
ncbi:MAG TPA: hypothetical protein VFE78_34280 [Gemmataceae bacterium]|nr:hypothetical protein [Gemmataceae bacterium]